MVALKRLKLASRCTESSSLVVLDPTTVVATGPCGASNPRTNLDEEATSVSPVSLTQHLGSAGWLFTCSKTELRTGPRDCVSSAQSHLPARTKYTKRTNFHDLPTEIHFHIATYLPDHALHILARYGYSKRVRRAYQAADPRSRRLDMRHLSMQERSIYDELNMRDIFEEAPLPRPCSSPFYKGVWGSTVFHCYGCQESVGCTHFPLKEMEESVKRRTGMSKITERKCFSRIIPVKLWDKEVTTWDQLQEAWDNMDDVTTTCTILSDFGPNGQKPVKDTCGTRSDRYTDIPNTLRLTNLDRTLYHPHHLTRHLGIEVTAEYYIDLYTLFRFSATDGASVCTFLARKAPYICPHLNLVKLMSRRMSTQPIDFRPRNPAHRPSATVADILCKTLEAAAWRPDPSAPYQRPDKPLRRIKEQTIWCGFKGDKCKTAVSLQRFRDSSSENSVGGLCGLSDLCRVRVVRRWRVDCGTGEEEWKAQNGVSIPAAMSVV